jgi:hypothetical protein
MNIDKRFVCQKCGGTSSTLPLNHHLLSEEVLAKRFKCQSCDYDIINDPERLDCLVRVTDHKQPVNIN